MPLKSSKKFSFSSKSAGLRTGLLAERFTRTAIPPFRGCAVITLVVDGVLVEARNVAAGTERTPALEETTLGREAAVPILIVECCCALTVRGRIANELIKTNQRRIRAPEAGKRTPAYSKKDALGRLLVSSESGLKYLWQCRGCYFIYLTEPILALGAFAMPVAATAGIC